MINRLIDLIPNSKEKIIKNLPVYILLVLSILLFITPFLPFLSASNEYKEILLENPYYQNSQWGWEIDNIDSVNLTLFELIDIYEPHNNFIDNDYYLFLLLTIVIMLFAIIIIVLSFFNQKIPLLIGSIILLVINLILVDSLTGHITFYSNHYNNGVGIYLLFILPILTIIVSLLWIKFDNSLKNYSK